MTESTMIQMTMAQPLSYRVDGLLSDIRPLRAAFEDLALALRAALAEQGVTAPILEATLDLRYVGDAERLTVPFPIDSADAAVCLSDPLPLDSQALREAVATFRHAHCVRTGSLTPDVPVELLLLRVRGFGQAA